MSAVYEPLPGATYQALPLMTNALNRFYMRLHEYKKTHADMNPECIYLLPEEMKEITESLWSLQTNVANGLLFGVKVVVVPFSEDPLFKRLQVMARLVGAPIEYDALEGIPATARFLKDGHGWCFMLGNPSSALVPIPPSWSEDEPCSSP